MTDRILLCVFFPCLFLCAGMVLAAIWLGEHALPEAYFQTTASLFVIGLATFLTWFVRTLSALRKERSR